MQAIYLTGPSVYLRAMVESDKDAASAWFQGPYPVNASRAEEFLGERHQGEPWDNEWRLFAVVHRESDEVIGSVSVRIGTRAATVRLQTAPWLPDADRVQAEVLRLVVPWLRNEREMLLVNVQIPCDQVESLAAAEAVGMTPTVRLRGHVARGSKRVDLLTFQIWDARLEAGHA